MTTPPLGRVLVIAGSDSGGGAGIQADIKTITCLGGFAMSAITALTAQSTRGVFGVQLVAASFIRQQIQVVIEDLGVDCLKVGMLATAEIIDCVATALEDLAPDVPLVLDPVMTAKGGELLLDPQAVMTLKRRLIPRATVITPNLPEAGALIDRVLTDEADMVAAVEPLRALGAGAVLLKGGHLAGNRLLDLLAHTEGLECFDGQRLCTRHTHGTGCSLASAIAVGIARRLTLVEAVGQGRRYVRKAIETAPGLGHGHGPLHHGWPCCEKLH